MPHDRHRLRRRHHGRLHGVPAPTPSESTDSSATTSTGGDTGTSAQLLTEDGTVADGSVAVSYTAEAGSPTVTATVSNACAGTVYKTGVMAATS
ncbi:hypothetical protein [Streptomyces sp. B21-083]|uniref:hypothetical protein n=1 Tax=Streptomyces sp. B21-083 TaxID=3039410 RepID=UPI002FF42A3D